MSRMVIAVALFAAWGCARVDLRRMGYIQVSGQGDFFVEIGMARRVLATYGVNSLAGGRSIASHYAERAAHVPK